MKHKLTSNLSLKLLSLVFAFLIWLLVMNIDNPIVPKLFKDVKIQVINADSVTEIDKVFDIVSEETVVLKVTERRNIVQGLTSDDFTVVADMESLNDMDSVPLTVTCRNPAVTWDEIEIAPASMKVKLEQKKESEFVVNVSTTGGKPPTGFEVGKTEVVQGKTVQIAGPESMIDRIGQVVAYISVGGLKTDQRLTVKLTVIDKFGESFTDAQMSRLQIKDSEGVLIADNTVMVDVSLWRVANSIPLEVKVTGTPADGYYYSGVSTVPETVSLVGTEEAIKEIQGKLVIKNPVSVEGATSDVSMDIDLTETLADNDALRLAADSDPTITVTAKIEKTGDQTLTIPLSNLEIQNRPANMSLTFSPADEITVIVHANNESDTIQVSDIKASIDLAACAKAGTYEIPVVIELPKGYKLVSEVKLVVTAEEQLQENNDEDAGE